MRRESIWLGGALARFPRAELDPVVSIGSGTEHFRMTFQPWIEAAVFRPLATRSVNVLHHELVAGPGVDIAGDLTDPDVVDRIAAVGPRAVLCLNVLEHVPDPQAIARGLTATLPSGGLLFVSVPRRYPYHPDPIDTMFRPTTQELRGLFDGAELVESAAIRCESLVAHWVRKPGKVDALRKLVPAREPSADAGDIQVPRRRHMAALARMAAVSTEVSVVIVRRR